MALPLAEPDPLAWRVALRIARRDERLLRVDPTGAVWVLNSAPIQAPDLPPRELSWDTAVAIARTAFRPAPVPVLDLQLLRAGGGTHLVPRFAEHALCGTAIAGPFTTGRLVTCPACSTALPPEA